MDRDQNLAVLVAIMRGEPPEGLPEDILAMANRLTLTPFPEKITPAEVRRLSIRLYPATIEMFAEMMLIRYMYPTTLVTLARQLGVYEGRLEPLVSREALREHVDSKNPELYNILFEAQIEGLFNNEAEGILYARRLTSPEYWSTTVKAASLIPEQLERMKTYLENSGMELEQLLDSGEDAVRRVVTPEKMG